MRSVTFFLKNIWTPEKRGEKKESQSITARIRIPQGHFSAGSVHLRARGGQIYGNLQSFPCSRSVYGREDQVQGKMSLGNCKGGTLQYMYTYS